ncbi:MAG: hypothetical protein A2219_07340 [Elusimicrobia bacterium RIFOXYA2_FULL_50_26]|nr:MAG: hypothetical protein A2219_07340 [Elusimicrobia bacterium RIFOXYA2_FULL_50_26]
MIWGTSLKFHFLIAAPSHMVIWIKSDTLCGFILRYLNVRFFLAAYEMVVKIVVFSVQPPFTRAIVHYSCSKYEDRRFSRDNEPPVCKYPPCIDAYGEIGGYKNDKEKSEENNFFHLREMLKNCAN